MKSVSIYNTDDLTLEQARQIAILINSVWPDPGKSLDEFAQSILESEVVKRCYVMWEGEQAIAMAQTFPRLIRHEGGTLEAVALACVCVHERLRGFGYGQRVVSEVFKAIDDSQGGVVLFQTGVPEFYKKLGCVLVDNPFWNSSSDDPTKSPWWDKYVMIYSKNTPWPSGPIDLNGSGY
jgi:GNAT superfamily N-acetyltransferase